MIVRDEWLPPKIKNKGFSFSPSIFHIIEDGNPNQCTESNAEINRRQAIGKEKVRPPLFAVDVNIENPREHFSKNCLGQVPVAHFWNPSYCGDKDQEEKGSKPAWANRARPYLKKNPHKKRTGGIVQSVGPEFKYPKNTKQKPARATKWI
jgi:hypothetical protein